MRIETVTPYHLQVPVPRDDLAGGDGTVFLVEVQCADGNAAGWGEAYAGSPQELVDAVAVVEPLLVGADPLSRVVLGERCRQRLHDAGWDAHSAAGVLSAVDMALWDLAGQACGAACWQLAGGANFALLDAYAVASTSHDAEDVLSWAKAASRQYFSAMRFDISANPHEGVEIVQRARRVVGSQTRFIADVASAITDIDEALQVGAALGRADVFWCEDLLGGNDFTQWARICREVAAPVAGGKLLAETSEVWRCLAAAGVEILALDLRLCGGLTGGLIHAQLARVHGVRTAVWAGVTPLGVLAAAHAALAMPNAIPLVPAPAMCYNNMVNGEVIVEDGVLELPSRPGLGASVDRGFVADYSLPLPEPSV